MKSASFQSLDARNLFLSIDELNDLTRQINESEEFNNEIDLEYCEHRDKLRPDQRRITLLRNKNAAVIDLEKKKEKISHAWSGLKSWLGEERVKLKDVVQKHASMQRVGALNPISRSQSTEPNTSSYGKIKFGSFRKLTDPASHQSTPSTSHRPQTIDDDRLSEISEIDDMNGSFSRSKSTGENSNLSRSQSRTGGSLERDAVPKFIQSFVRKGNKTTEVPEVNLSFNNKQKIFKT